MDAQGVEQASGGTVASLQIEPAVPRNLPGQLTSFVGRARELAQLAEVISGARLVTLTGAGGCGKSRLALQAASRARGDYVDGVWWVELAPIADPAMVAPALAQVLGVRPLPGQTELDAAVAYLASRRALVVLDNCEHLLGAAAEVAEALALGCPELRVVATSREPLGVAGETHWRVPSLSLPEDGAKADASDAVALFLERAQMVRPGFALEPDTAEAVVGICAELDGIPLAIELAAARLRVLSVAQIHQALADRFGLLTGGVRTSLARQQTLRASVEWSHELLAEPERVLLRRLGVFTGGFSLEAAEAVCQGDGIEPHQVLDLVAALVDKSLVQAEERAQAVRYRLLETVRAYALEQLEEAGETQRIRDAHRDFYLEFAERIEPELITPRQPELLDLLDPEAPNLTQAIEWAADTEPDKALRLCVALTIWSRLRGLFPQGEASFRRALDAARPERSVLRSRALWGRAYLLMISGEFEAAFPAAQQALAEAEQVGDESTMARALYVIGTVVLFPDPVGSRVPLERARELAMASGDEFALGFATGVLAISYGLQDDHERAMVLFAEVLPWLERTDYHEGWAWYWIHVSRAHSAAGEQDRCMEACERAIAAAREVGDVTTESAAAGTLALTQIDAGEPERALERLIAIRERCLTRGAGFSLPGLQAIVAQAHAATGRLEEARSLFDEVFDAPRALIWPHMSLAEVLRLLGDPEDARTAARRGLELAEEIANPRLVAGAQVVLGRLAAGDGEWTEAQRLHHDALAAIVRGGYTPDLPGVLDGLAEVAAGLESYAEAARILGAAERARGELGLVAWKHHREETEALAARTREALGEQDFEQAWAEGEALTLDEAVAYVRRARGERKRPSVGWESLTPTEVKVAGHASAGLTNPEIAERMFISRGTVKTHLSRIYAKLGAKNRSELAVEATRRAGTPQG